VFSSMDGVGLLFARDGLVMVEKRAGLVEK
jgi:hypothetical protein